MRFILTAVLTAALILSLSGCGLSEAIGQKIGAEIGEKILEGAGGGDIEIDGDKIEFEGASGERVVIGGSEWPDSDIAKAVPEFKAGKITSVVDTSTGLMIGAEEVEPGDYEKYVSSLKDIFTSDVFETSAEDYAAFGGANGDGITVTVQYTPSSRTIIIGAGKNS